MHFVSFTIISAVTMTAGLVSAAELEITGCGSTAELAVEIAQHATNPSVRLTCLSFAVEKLLKRVEDLRTGKEPFETVRARAYLHDEKK